MTIYFQRLKKNLCTMSNPDPSKDYADYLEPNTKDCPYCGAKDQEGEDLGDHPSYLSFVCEECGKDFDSLTKKQGDK